MAQIRELKKRIGAVKTIQRITKTMQMIATAKFTQALQRAKATKPYTEKVRQLVGEVSAAAGDIAHPLIDGPNESPRRELMLVLTSDRGLCGAYNANILRLALRQVRAAEERGAAVDLHTVGKKAQAFFKFQRIAVAERHPLGDNPSYEDVERLANQFIDAFTAGAYDTVRVVSMKFISNARQEATVTDLLPLRDEAEAGPATASVGAAAVYEFSPSAEELLAHLLPLTVKSTLFQAVNDAIVSEHVMRMVAMKAASDNASDLGRSLKRDFNRARQTQITTELMEVISGAAALE